MEETLRVGVIASTHGIRGEVKVFPTTDDAKRFEKGSSSGYWKRTKNYGNSTG